MHPRRMNDHHDDGAARPPRANREPRAAAGPAAGQGHIGTKRTALVTGASSGIGLATARALARQGWTVFATARHPQSAAELRALAADSPSVEVRTLDVTDDWSVRSCVGAIVTNLGRIDLLVNNAGAGHRGTLEQLTIDEIATTMDVNFLGVVRVTKAVLPVMRAARRGRIVTVTSLNGVVALPFSDAYNAAKFAVEGLMEGLATVLREFGVFVSVLEPGPVRTRFFDAIGGRGRASDPADPYAAPLARYDARIAGMGAAGQSAASVADVICRIAEEPEPALRYQSSAEATEIAARKLIDPTGRSLVDATAALLQP